MSPIEPDQLRLRIENAHDLPTLSAVANQIALMANSPTTSAADIGRLIESDQALTANVLKLVNSAYYSFPQRIRSVQHAVVILGFSKVKNVVLAASVLDATHERATGGLDLRRLWQHAMGTAIASKVVADQLGAGAQSEDAFTAGLLHDIGKFILAHLAPDDYAPVLESARHEVILDAENGTLGFNHTSAGRWLATRWRMPTPIQESIQHHHRPAAAREYRSLTAAVHLGDILTRALAIGNSGDDFIPAISPEIVAQYRLGARFLDNALRRVAADVERAGDFFQLLDA